MAWKQRTSHGRAEGARLAVQHDRLIAHLATLSEFERDQIIAASGIDAWQSERQFDEMAMCAAIAAADMMPDPEMPEDMQARTALEAHRARERAARLQAEADGNLLGLVDLHEKVAPPRSYKTSEKARLYVGRFIEIVGDLAPQAVTRQHVIKFRAALEAKGLRSSRAQRRGLTAGFRLFLPSSDQQASILTHSDCTHYRCPDHFEPPSAGGASTLPSRKVPQCPPSEPSPGRPRKSRERWP